MAIGTGVLEVQVVPFATWAFVFSLGLLPLSLVSVFAIFNGGGRPLFGMLADRLNPRNTAMLSFGLISIASFLPKQEPTLTRYILSFALLWGSIGAWPAIAPTSTGAFFGIREYPRCYGVVYLAYGAGALIGPTLAGSQIGVFPQVAVLAIIGIGIAFWLMRPPSQGRQIVSYGLVHTSGPDLIDINGDGLPDGFEAGKSIATPLYKAPEPRPLRRRDRSGSEEENEKALK